MSLRRGKAPGVLTGLSLITTSIDSNRTLIPLQTRW